MPNQRCLEPQMKANVLEMMEIKAIKKLIQAKVQAETGKVVTLRDLSNIRCTITNIINLLLIINSLKK